MRYCNRHCQHGVALLLALGVLSLLLATGIAFVSNAMLAQKSASAYRFRAQTQLLGRSAVNRVMMLMRYYMKENDLTGIANLKSTVNSEFFDGEDVPAAGYSDGLTATDSTNLLYAKIDGHEYKRGTETWQWEYLWDKYNGGKRHANAKLLGRFAYRVLPALGSVNFSEILRGNPNLSSNSMSNWKVRRGFGIRELNLSGCNLQEDIFDNRFDKTKEPCIVSESLRQQDSSRSLDYSSYQNLFNQAPSTMNADIRKFIRDYLPLGGTEEEVYFHSATYDKNSFNPSNLSGYTRYHRFDLTRTDWNLLGGTGTLANKDELVRRLIGDDTEPLERSSSDTVTDSTEKTSDCIPALRRIGDTAGAYSSLTVRRKQIAANLIDYCDTDNIPTSDSADWDTTAPSYTGNEATPYINEIMLSPSVAMKRQEVNTGDALNPQYQYTYTGQIGLRMAAVEIFNMYKAEIPKCNLALSGEFELEIKADAELGSEASRTQTITVRFDIPFSSAPDDWVTSSSNRYAHKVLYLNGVPASATVSAGSGWSSFTSAPSSIQLNNPLDVKVTVKSFKITKAYLKTAEGNADFVRDLDFTLSNAESTGTGSGGTSSQVTVYPHIGCEVDDPRENLYQGSASDVALMNWRPIQLAAVSGTGSDAGPEAITGTAAGNGAALGTLFTFNKQNDFCNPANADSNIAKDMETATVPEEISTAYISNKPMATLVELGAIHRAAKWQTLNLCAGKRTPADTPLSGIDAAGDKYSEGDAGILDQVKLTPRVLVPHRLYINNPPGTGTNEAIALYGGLFRGLVWDWDKHYNYKFSGTAIAETNARNAGNILANVSRDKFFSRAEVINYSSGTNKLLNAYGLTAPRTDAQRETIPVLVSSLISFFPCSPDPIAVLLTAQSIRDIGTANGFTFSKLRNDGSGASDSATVKSGQFDMTANTYFDEITGTARFYVEIGTDATSRKVKPLRIEPLD